ncbi:MAG: hypothetical protein SGARI_005270 [Bacillariaceae sp.]
MTKVSTSPTKEAPAKKESASAKVDKPGSSSYGAVEFSGTKQKIMMALAAFYSNGIKEVSKEKLSTASKIAEKTVLNNLPKLRDDGYIETPPKMVKLTEKGIAALGDSISIATSNEDIQDKIKADLKPPGVALFNKLLDGNTWDKDDLANDLGYKDGKKTKTFANLIGKMRTSKIVDYPEPTTIALVKATCFPFSTDEKSEDS